MRQSQPTQTKAREVLHHLLKCLAINKWVLVPKDELTLWHRRSIHHFCSEHVSPEAFLKIFSLLAFFMCTDSNLWPCCDGLKAVIDCFKELKMEINESKVPIATGKPKQNCHFVARYYATPSTIKDFRSFLNAFDSTITYNVAKHQWKPLSSDEAKFHKWC